MRKSQGEPSVATPSSGELQPCGLRCGHRLASMRTVCALRDESREIPGLAGLGRTP